MPQKMSTKNIAIRLATPQDANRVTELCFQLGYKVLESDIRKRIQEFADKQHVVTFVAEDQSLILGWLQASIRSSLESGELAEITGLVVDERYRGQGIGKELVRRAEEWARNMGYHSMEVRTNVIRQETHNFYKRIGFEEKKRQTVFQKELL